MAGLSILLEAQKGVISHNNKNPQVINKASMITINNNNKSKPSSSSSTSNEFTRSSPFPVPPFLEHCFLCRRKLLPGEDIYMYKGDKAFCSVGCRCRQIFMDEEEIIGKENCSLAAMKPTSASAAASASPSDSRRCNKSKNRTGGGFAY